MREIHLKTGKVQGGFLGPWNPKESGTTEVWEEPQCPEKQPPEEQLESRLSARVSSPSAMCLSLSARVTFSLQTR